MFNKLNNKYFINIKKVFTLLLKKIYMCDIVIIYQCECLIQQNSYGEIKKVTHENLVDVLDFNNKRYIKVFREFLSSNDVGYYSYLDGKCIHRMWLKFPLQKVYFHKGVSYLLKKNEIYIHYVETAKGVRGQNIFPHVLYYVTKKYSNYNPILAIHNDNEPSKKAVEKVGYIPRKRIKIKIFFGIKKVVSYE